MLEGERRGQVPFHSSHALRGTVGGVGKFYGGKINYYNYSIVGKVVTQH